ncbi:hypothetical protein [Rubripirellula amarantea]|nr:hypothetical protein [Rubripirellula amarantea]
MPTKLIAELIQCQATMVRDHELRDLGRDDGSGSILVSPAF